jgi:flagellar assembly protein FliH
MLLSSNVIKQVSRELENCSVYPKTRLKAVEQENPVPISADPENVKQESVKTEAELILINAQSEADELLQQTYNRISAIEKEAYEKGYQQCEQDAQNSWVKVRDEFRTTTRTVLNELEKLRENIYRDTEEEMVELAVIMAKKIVCRQLDINPDTIIDIVKAACNQARDCKEVILYVPAEQLENIKASQGEIDAQLYKTEHFAIRSDPNIKSGGCRIETEQGYIDASIETMTEQLSKIFKEDSE